MRITGQLQYGLIKSGLQNTIEDLTNLNTELATGKKINKPSDDPLGVARAMDYRVTLSQNNQYQNIIDLTNARLNITATTVSSVSDIISQMISLVNKGQSSTDPTEKTADSLQASQLRDTLLYMANQKYGDSYLFSGFKSNQTSFTYNAATFQYDYNGDNNTVNVPVDQGATVAANAPGNTVFSPPLPANLPANLADGTPISYAQVTNPANGVNTLTVTIGTAGNPGYDTFSVSNYMDMANVAAYAWKDQNVDGTALDPSSSISAAMGSNRLQALAPVFEDFRSTIQPVTTDIALRLTTLDNTKTRLTSLSTILQNSISGIEGADMDQVAVDIQSTQLALTAMRTTAGKILSESLFNFLTLQ